MGEMLRPYRQHELANWKPVPPLFPSLNARSSTGVLIARGNPEKNSNLFNSTDERAGSFKPYLAMFASLAWVTNLGLSHEAADVLISYPLRRF